MENKSFQLFTRIQWSPCQKGHPHIVRALKKGVAPVALSYSSLPSRTRPQKQNDV